MGLSLTLDGQPVVGYSNLQIKSVARGGFASVTFNMNRKLDKSLLATFTDVMVYDTTTGEQVGGGRLMEQGRNDDGTWGITCLGEGLASMQDRRTPYALIDQSMDQWRRFSRTSKRIDATQTQYPNQSDDDPTLMFDSTEDKPINTGALVLMANKVPQLCDMLLGGIGFRHKSGVSNTNLRARSYAGTTTVPNTVLGINDAWDTTISSRRLFTVNGGFSGRNVAAVGWACTTGIASASVDDAYWSAIRDVIIRTQLLDRNGALITTGYTTESVRIDQAFIDWCARYAPRLDIANATVDTGIYAFDQLSWLDGIHGMDMLDYLIESEPGFTWAVWEKSTNGKWVTELRVMPSVVRYEASTDDGFNAPSPTTEIFDTVTVTGKTPGGQDINVTRTQNVPDLTSAGIPRETTIQLGSEQWSTTNANKAGDTFLAEHAVAPNAGTLTVARKILDAQTGRYVSPHAIRPGTLIRVRGVQPTPDTLNATSPDGVTIFRIVSTTYDDDSGAATLELDQYTLTESRALARIARARTRR